MASEKKPLHCFSWKLRKFNSRSTAFDTLLDYGHKYDHWQQKNVPSYLFWCYTKWLPSDLEHYHDYKLKGISNVLLSVPMSNFSFAIQAAILDIFFCLFPHSWHWPKVNTFHRKNNHSCTCRSALKIDFPDKITNALKQITPNALKHSRSILYT